MEPKEYSCFNELGLRENVTYHFKTDGTVDWQKMILPEHIVHNKKLTKEKNIEKLDDSKKIIKLNGIRDVAQLRGYKDVTYEIGCPSLDYVCVSCSINWNGNYETGFKDVVYTAIGDAHLRNTSGFASRFLAPIAENRSFVRCVKGFLRIPILGQVELEDASAHEGFDDVSSPPNPHIILTEIMEKKGFGFDDVIEKLSTMEDIEIDISKINEISDIPKTHILALITALKAKTKPRKTTRKK